MNREKAENSETATKNGTKKLFGRHQNGGHLPNYKANQIWEKKNPKSTIKTKRTQHQQNKRQVGLPVGRG